jgi:hypothetical protein
LARGHAHRWFALRVADQCIPGGAAGGSATKRVAFELAGRRIRRRFAVASKCEISVNFVTHDATLAAIRWQTVLAIRAEEGLVGSAIAVVIHAVARLGLRAAIRGG